LSQIDILSCSQNLESNFDLKNKINLFNIFEQNKILLDAQLYEVGSSNEENKFNGVSLALLYTDLTFCIVKNINDLFSNDGKSKSIFDIKENSLNLFHKLCNNKSNYFDFLSYLPHIKVDKISQNFSENKILQFSNDNTLIFNFSSFSDRIIIFNTSSFSVIRNICINPLDLCNIFNRGLTQSLIFFINTHLNKKWTVPQFEAYVNLLKEINKNKKNISNYKILANLLVHIDDHRLKYIQEVAEFSNEEHFNNNLNKKIDLMYMVIMKMVSHSFETGENKFFDFFQILDSLSGLLIKILENSKLIESGLYENLKDNSKILFLKLQKRKINLEEIFLNIDKDKKFYIPKSEIIKIITALPIGLTEHEVENIFSSNNFFDEYNNFLYRYFIDHEENLINNLISLKKQGFAEKKYFGYFFKIKSKDSRSNYKFSASRTHRRNSDPLEIKNLTQEIENKNFKKIEIVNKKILDYICRETIDISIVNIIYVPHLNLFFILSNKNEGKILILKIDPKFDNKSKIKTDFNLLGYIDVCSAFNPKLLYFVEEKNLLITQSFNKNKDKVDLILIDIYKDIIDVYQTNNLWKITIKDSYNRIKSVSSSGIEEVSYLAGNKLIYLRNSKNEVKILNPKTNLNDLSIKYFYEKNKESVYDYVCRTVCENPSEFTGDSSFKTVKDIKLDSVINSHFISFNYVENRESLYPFELVVVFGRNKSSDKIISATFYGIYSMFLNLPVKSADNPIVESEMYALQSICTKEKKRILKETESILSEILNENLNIRNDRSIQSKYLKEKVKNIIIHTSSESGKSNKTLISPEDEKKFNYLKNTHQIMYLLKSLNLCSEYKDILYFTSHYKLNDLKINSNSLIDKNQLSRGWQKISQIFYDLGLNSMSYFRRIKNSKIEFIKMNKNSLANLLNTKIDLFIDKKALPIEKVLNISSQDFECKENEINYEMLHNQIFTEEKILTSRPKLTYKKENENKIMSCLQNNEESMKPQNEEELTPNSDSDFSTPLDSAVKKLALKFLEKEVNLETSFSLFDMNNEEIIDKKQFINGLKYLNMYQDFNTLEFEALFKKIDTNGTDCVTEDEYNYFVLNCNIKGVMTQIKKETADKLNDKFYVNMSDPKLFNQTIYQSINDKRKKLYGVEKEDYGYLCFLKFIQFIENKIGIQIEISFKLFDVLHNGIVFYNQFIFILKQYKCTLVTREIDAIFSALDAQGKKFYINESDYYSVIKNILYNPEVNRKKFNKFLNEENSKFEKLNIENSLPASVTKNEFSYKLTEGDYSFIISNILRKTSEYLKNKKLENNSNKSIYQNFFFDNLEYLPIEKLMRKIKQVIPEISNFEIKVLCDYYFDVNKMKILLVEDFKNKIENFLSNESESSVLNSKINLLNFNTAGILKTSESNFEAVQTNQSIIDEEIQNLKKTENSQNLFYTLQTIQESLKATGLKPEDIFFMLDKDKRGYITISSTLKILPLKFNVNLTINQQIQFFNFLDKDKDGLVVYSDFLPFFTTQFSTLTFEDQSIEFYSLIENFQEKFLIFMNKLQDVDLRNIFDFIDSQTEKGYLLIDDMLNFFKQILNAKLSIHDVKLLLELIFNQSQKTSNSKNSIMLGLREFLIMLEIFGINTLLFTQYKNLNEVVDSNLLQLLNFVNSKGINSMMEYLDEFDENKDGFLNAKEFKFALQKLKINDIEKSKLYSLIHRFCDSSNNNLISIPNLVLILNYFTYAYCSFITKDAYAITKFEIESIEKINKFNFFSFNNLKNEVSDIVYLSTEYQNLIYKGVFSGLIIFSKFFEINNFSFQILNRKKRIFDYFTLFSKKANEIIIKSFNDRILSNNINLNRNSKNHLVMDLSETDVPNIRINILDQREMINRKIFSSNLGESFSYYHPELKRTIQVTKYRKSMLIKTVSQCDGQNLLNHVEYSLKVNHYIRNYLAEKENKQNINSCFSSSKFIFSNIGVYTRQTVINQKEEEEIFILDELINEDDYISFEELINSNGGLLAIPELFDTDLTFYMIRFWASKILQIFNLLKEMSVCLKYINLSDIFISKDGKNIKLRNIQHLNYFDMRGKILSGPDLRNILLLYNKNNLKIEDTDISGINSYIDKVTPLSFEDYNDSFIAPEMILKDSKSHSNKVDTWLFGVLIFSILFGKEPKSYISQLKEYIDHQTNLIFDKISFPMNIISEDNHFFYYPFKDLEGYNLEKVITPSIKLKSYSAIIPKDHLNNEIENNTSINGLGIILDLINACMAPNPETRPDLSTLLSSDIFKFDNYEMILVNKFSANCLNYLSPDLIIIKNILQPLRKISARVMQNLEVINEYENFIFKVICNLNEYLFAKKYTNKKYSSSTSMSLNHDEENKRENNFVINSENYSKPNSQIIKTIFDNKIIDIVNFLIIRHFYFNLKIFKKNSEKRFSEIFKVNNNMDKKTEVELRRQKYFYMKEEMERECGRLLKAYVDFLHNCVISMSNYDHIISCYVENIIEYIGRLIIGEDHIFLSLNLTNKNLFSDEKNGIKKYLHYRTFFRNENIINNSFSEDEADKIWSILNNNVDLSERESFWSSELYHIVHPLFREALTEIGNSNYKYPVIKHYFNVINDQARNINDLLDNPFLDSNLNQYYSVSSILNKNQLTLTPAYLAELLALNECTVNLIGNENFSEPGKHNANKKSALTYINSILRTRNVDKIRALFDFKIHMFIEKFLFIHINDLMIKTEVLNILKEISFGLVDIDELSWLFGNNYTKIFEKTISNKSDPMEGADLNDELNWDSNFSLVQFLNKTLQTSHSFILQFTDRFLGIGSNFSSNNNKSSNLNSYSKRTQATTFIKEMGRIFCNPLFLKPLLRILQKNNESIQNRQACLEILFNLMISNDEKLIINLNSTLCNFYEALIKLMQSHSLILFNDKLESASQENDYSSIALSNSNATQNFKLTIKNIIYILIEIQNPLIKSQIFKSYTMQKFMKENNLSLNERYDIDEITSEFKEFKEMVNFTKSVDKINKLINSFKCWIQHFYLENLCNVQNQDLDKNFEVIIISLIHIMNVEWKDGLKNSTKNCLIFNIVKLFEWLCKKKLHKMLFNMSESASLSLIIYFMTKIKDMYLGTVIEENVIEEKKSRVNVSSSSVKSKKIDNEKNKESQNSNLINNKFITLQKIYHLISIKMLNILSNIFAMNDDYYNGLLVRSKFGFLIGELMKIQYNLLGQILDKKKNDINLLNVKNNYFNFQNFIFLELHSRK
jgi:Ca2+-binding EF-hand superfamily protein